MSEIDAVHTGHASWKVGERENQPTLSVSTLSARLLVRLRVCWLRCCIAVDEVLGLTSPADDEVDAEARDLAGTAEVRLHSCEAAVRVRASIMAVCKAEASR